MNIVTEVKNEINKMSQMDNKKRKDYFKTYYLKSTLIGIVVIILLIWFVKDTFFQKEPVNMGCAYNVELTDEQKEVLTDGYMKYYGYNTKKCRAAIATDNMFEDTAQKMDSNAHEMALIAQIVAGEIYYLILDRDMLEMMTNSGIYANLEEILPQDKLDELSDMMISIKDDESGAYYPVGIDLNKLGFLSSDTQEGYIVFTISRPDEDYPERLIEYLQHVN